MSRVMGYKKREALTEKQSAVLEFIRAEFAAGRCPTYKDIAKEFSLKSDQSVIQYLDLLEDFGAIKRGEGRGLSTTEIII